MCGKDNRSSSSPPPLSYRPSPHNPLTHTHTYTPNTSVRLISEDWKGNSCEVCLSSKADLSMDLVTGLPISADWERRQVQLDPSSSSTGLRRRYTLQAGAGVVRQLRFSRLNRQRPRLNFHLQFRVLCTYIRVTVEQNNQYVGRAGCENAMYIHMYIRERLVRLFVLLPMPSVSPFSSTYYHQSIPHHHSPVDHQVSYHLCSTASLSSFGAVGSSSRDVFIHFWLQLSPTRRQ